MKKILITILAFFITFNIGFAQSDSIEVAKAKSKSMIKQLFDLKMANHSLQIRQMSNVSSVSIAGNKELRDSIEVFRDNTSTDIFVRSYMDHNALWPNVFKRTKYQRKDDALSENSDTAYVDFDMKFTPLGENKGREGYNVDISNKPAGEEILNQAQSDSVKSLMNALFSSSYDKPKDAPVNDAMFEGMDFLAEIFGEGDDELNIDEAKLEEIAFESQGYYELEDGKAPHVKYTYENGELKNKIEKSLCFVRGNNITINPKIKVKGSDGKEVNIKAVISSPNSTLFENIEDGAIIITGKGKLSNEYIVLNENEEITVDIGNVVDYHKTFIINWFISKENEGKWKEIGQSSNKVYVVYNTPQIEYYPKDERVFYYSCSKAKGLNIEQEVIKRIWNPFESLMLNLSDFTEEENVNKQLTYYQYPFPESKDIEILDHSNGDGDCRAFSELMLLIFRSQGFNSELLVASPDSDDGFIVKEWNFIGSGSSTKEGYSHLNIPKKLESVYIGTYQDESGNLIDYYDLVPEIRKEGHIYEWYYSEVNDDPSGISGQNVQNPYSDFNQHVLIEYNGKIYDPSYGVKYEFLDDFFKQAIDGFFEQVKVRINEKKYNTDVNGDGVLDDNLKWIYLYFKSNN